MKTDQFTGIQVQADGSYREISDVVIRGDTFAIVLNGELITEQVASSNCLRELGAGFVVAEGIAENITNVEVEDSTIYVEADTVFKSPKVLEYRTGGGKGIAGTPKTVESSYTISPECVFHSTEAIFSDTWDKTGGVHCSVLFSGEEKIKQICDIGRHNTVDKIIGYAILQGIDLSSCHICCTGRQPSAMVKKAANAGLPIIISRAASTAAGITTARDAGITLICFSRGTRFTVYSHPERVKGLNQHK